MRFLLAMLLLAMFAGCIQPNESVLAGPPMAHEESRGCSGLIALVAVNLDSLNLPPLDLLSASQVFTNPTDENVLLMMGIECEGWSESGSGVLLQGEGWNVYPLHQFGDAPYFQERHDARWIMGSGRAESMILPLPIDYNIITGYDSQSRWLDLTRLETDVAVEQIEFTFIRASAAMTLSWQGDSAMGLANCLVRDDSLEAVVLGPLDCDLHSSLAMALDEVDISIAWQQFVAQTI